MKRAQGQGCPVCSGRKVLPGFNDLLTLNPEVASLWHPTKNGSLTPQSVTPGSSRKVWWICDKGHESETTVSRKTTGSSCLVCINQVALPGFNDLATTHPKLAVQWHPTKNGSLKPSQVVAGSGKRFWWICDKGHEWKIPVLARTRGSGCPFCSGRFAIQGVNDLVTTHPNLAAQWHSTKNHPLQMTQVKAGTNKSVWWICDKGHEWKSVVAQRAAGSGCPVCIGVAVLEGVNDLATTHPKLAVQWHPTKNGSLKPSQVVAGSGKRFWWICDKGHEWQAISAARVAGSNCPVCSNHKTLAGFNDLATTHPHLVSEWHPTKNSGLSPSSVSAGTPRKFWWICDKGHEWTAITSHRAKGSGCPVCAGKVALVGFNDLQTLYPVLSETWHPTWNEPITTKDVTSGSNKKFWWQCVEGHVWQAVVSSRVRGNGCPACASYGFDPDNQAVLYFIRNKALKARKLGITNVGTSRLESFLKAGWQQIFKIEAERGSVVREVETRVFKWIRDELSLPAHLGPDEVGRLGGWTETFSEDGPSDQEVMLKIKFEYREVIRPSYPENPTGI